MDATTLAYCAGIIDADGTIGIKRNTYSMRVVGDSKQATFSERVCVKQVELAAVELLHSLFGGSRRVDRSTAKRGRDLEVWQVTDRQAAACLTALLPYLRIKKAQAENCLALRAVKELSKVARVAPGRGHVGGARRPTHLSEQMATLHLRAGELNRVGVQ